MGPIVKIMSVALIFGVLTGCTKKLVKIDSVPSFADIRVNDEYVGKTPLYHQFTDRWYPWPIKKTEDYLVEAQRAGYEPQTQYFPESPVGLDISYVPDEILFVLKPQDRSEGIK